MESETQISQGNNEQNKDGWAASEENGKSMWTDFHKPTDNDEKDGKTPLIFEAIILRTQMSI